jgi:hypothetical protein
MFAAEADADLTGEGCTVILPTWLLPFMLLTAPQLCSPSRCSQLKRLADAAFRGGDRNTLCHLAAAVYSGKCSVVVFSFMLPAAEAAG